MKFIILGIIILAYALYIFFLKRKEKKEAAENKPQTTSGFILDLLNPGPLVKRVIALFFLLLSIIIWLIVF